MFGGHMEKCFEASLKTAFNPTGDLTGDWREIVARVNKWIKSKNKNSESYFKLVTDYTGENPKPVAIHLSYHCHITGVTPLLAINPNQTGHIARDTGGFDFVFFDRLDIENYFIKLFKASPFCLLGKDKKEFKGATIMNITKEQRDELQGLAVKAQGGDQEAKTKLEEMLGRK